MEDPRELVRYKPFILNRKGDDAWTMGSNRPAPWHIVVRFANAILAANEAWLDSQTPTLEELRERYPEMYMSVGTHAPTDEQWWALYHPHGLTGASYSGTFFANEKAALRWLATELAKGDE